MALYPIKISELPQSTTIPTSALLPVAFPGEILTQSVTYGTLLCSVSAALIDTSIPELKQNIAGRVPLSGGTITGHISTGALANPLRSTELINKGYADSKFAPITGTVMTGFLVLTGAPYNANDAATKAYVDANASTGISLATAAANFLPLSGNRTIVNSLTTQGGFTVQGITSLSGGLSCTRFSSPTTEPPLIPYAVGVFWPNAAATRTAYYTVNCSFEYYGAYNTTGYAGSVRIFVTKPDAGIGTITTNNQYLATLGYMVSAFRPGHMLFLNRTSGASWTNQAVMLRYIENITPTTITWIAEANPNYPTGATSAGPVNGNIQFCEGAGMANPRQVDARSSLNWITGDAAGRGFYPRIYGKNIANVCYAGTGKYIVNLDLDSYISSSEAGGTDNGRDWFSNYVIPFADGHRVGLNAYGPFYEGFPTPDNDSNATPRAYAPGPYNYWAYPVGTNWTNNPFRPQFHAGFQFKGFGYNTTSDMSNSNCYFVTLATGGTYYEGSQINTMCFVMPSRVENLNPPKLYANNPY